MLAAGLATMTTAQADMNLASQKGCLACHSAEKKLVGPSFRDVAKRYAGSGADELAASIKRGGSGKWGTIPMPAQPNLTNQEARQIATWILSNK
jgi:cytochrome c